MLDANIKGMKPQDIANIIKEIDYVGNGKIMYTEFLAATMTFTEDLNDEIRYLVTVLRKK